jgi:hypothetical protein
MSLTSLKDDLDLSVPFHKQIIPMFGLGQDLTVLREEATPLFGFKEEGLDIYGFISDNP